MKVVLCGSISFLEEILRWERELKGKGVDAIVPLAVKEIGKDPRTVMNYDEYIELKPKYIRDHYGKIADSDAILVVSGTKNGISGYLGGATFAEVAIAYYMKKKIFFINPIPQGLPYTDELLAFKPTVVRNAADILDGEGVL